MSTYENVLGTATESKGQSRGSSVADTLSTIGVQKLPATTPSTSMKFLQDHLMSKKRSRQKEHSHSKSALKQSATKQSDTENTLPIKRFCGELCDWDPQDEYDPMAPNNYEILQADYLKAEEQRLIAATMAKHNKQSMSGKIDTSLLNALDELEETNNQDAKPIRGTAIAPPISLQSTISTLPDPDIMDSLKTSEIGDKINPSSPVPSTNKIDGLSAAAKIMSKMGYKSGQGLGKDQQGMSEPLAVESCGTNMGRIVQAQTQSALVTSNNSPQLVSGPSQPVTDDNKHLGSQTRVLLLQNMVGPGEVDEDLEAETKEECTKYGEVIKCLIFEIPNKRVPDDQAVRIFIEFKTHEASQRALNDLDGRYFGGRVVKASFYNETRFNRYELGP